MKLHVINLDRSADRLAAFRKTNGHVDAERFPAIDGAAQSIERLVEQGTVAPNLRYSVGAVGAALSHLKLWELCIERNAPITVCEDDAVLHKDFDATATRLLGKLPAWDIVLWTWSFQSAVHFELLQGGGSCLAQCDFQEMQRIASRFQEASHAFDLYRLRRAFGAVCYSISPAGARKLKEAALPLRPMTVWVPLSADPVPNVGIDVVMCGSYDKLAAYVCVPPLALAPQQHETTIHGTKRMTADGR